MKRHLPWIEIALILGLLIIGSLMRIYGPTDSLDAQFFYTSEFAESFIKRLSPPEASAYLLNEILDFFFILTYSCLFLKLSWRVKPKRNLFVTAAISPGIFDIFETSKVVSLITNPDQVPPAWLGFTTAAKWILSFVFIVAILFKLRREKRTGI